MGGGGGGALGNHRSFESSHWETANTMERSLFLWFLAVSLPSLFLTRLELRGISKMSFQAYLPICFLDLSLSLNLLLVYIYFKFSSFCLCHTSLQSHSLFFVSQQKSLSTHLQNSLRTICRGWQAPVLSSLLSPGGSQSRKACGSPLKQL